MQRSGMGRRSFLAAGTAVAFASVARPTWAADPIKIGFLASMTGGAAVIGFNALAGARLAVQEINAKGGIGGRPIELVIGDDQSDPTAAVSETRRLILREHVSVMLGPLASQFALASIPIATQAKMPQIVTAGAAEIEPGFAPYAFSMNPSSKTQGALMANYVGEGLHAKSTAILADDGPQARDGVRFIQARLKELGIVETGVQQFRYRSADKTPQLLSLRNGNPEALVIWANTAEDFASILNGLKQIGWAPRMSGAIAETMFAPTTMGITGPQPMEAVAGVAYTGWTYCPGEDQGNLPFVQFKKALRALEPEKFPTMSWTIAGWSYDSAYIMKAAIEGSAMKSDGPTIAAWIEKNVASVPSVSAKLSSGPDTRFLVGASGMTMVQGLQEPSPEGLYQRVACTRG